MWCCESPLKYELIISFAPGRKFRKKIWWTFSLRGTQHNAADWAAANTQLKKKISANKSIIMHWNSYIHWIVCCRHMPFTHEQWKRSWLLRVLRQHAYNIYPSCACVRLHSRIAHHRHRGHIKEAIYGIWIYIYAFGTLGPGPNPTMTYNPHTNIKYILYSNNNGQRKIIIIN